jgi:hypothetical protein
MKRLFFVATVISFFVLVSACKKDDDKSSRFKLLTGVVWESDSLLINGVDASGPGQMLELFKGEARFKEDGTGTFGNFSGTWRFAQNETQLVIQSDTLPLPLSSNILLLTEEELKVSTSFPDPSNFANPPLQIRLTFTAK